MQTSRKRDGNWIFIVARGSFKLGDDWIIERGALKKRAMITLMERLELVERNSQF